MDYRWDIRDIVSSLFHKDMEFNLVPVGTDNGIRDLCCQYYIQFLEYVYIYTVYIYRNYTDHRESVSSIDIPKRL